MRAQGTADPATSLPLSFPPAISICTVCYCCVHALCMTIPVQGDRKKEGLYILISVLKEVTKCHGCNLGLGLGVSQAGFSGGRI